MTPRPLARRSAAVVLSGAMLGLALCVFDAMWNSRAPIVAADLSTQRIASRSASSRPMQSGVYVMAPSPRPAPVPAASHAPAPSQEPPFPFSFLGKITEGGQETILLYGAGRTLKVRHAGPLDDRYIVDDVFDDHVVIRYLPLGTRHVVDLASRQYEIPGSLRGGYPQD